MPTQSSVGAAAPSANAPTSSSESMRGRTRDRAHNRRSTLPNSQDNDKTESSTLRGRSRKRAFSPFDSTSRDPSSAVIMSPTRQHLLQKRLRETRREHCPSRNPSPSGSSMRRRRSRSRKRDAEPRPENRSRETPDIRSGLRNELHVMEENPASPDQFSGRRETSDKVA